MAHPGPMSPIGSFGTGRPSASYTTSIRSPEHIASGEPACATAGGMSADSTMANAAARNASERVNDQCSAEACCTSRPIARRRRLWKRDRSRM